MITYGGSSRAVKLVANVKIACMKIHSPNRALSKTRNGFALVVTLSLMILLTVIAVGLLSLSTISLRASGASADVAVARSNARMALMLALGDLQKHAGLDTRVTARADILDEKNPPVVGVWKSWEGSDHDDSGRPISPGDYRQTKEGRFLGWLTSGDPAVTSSSTSPPSTGKTKDSITLLGEASVGEGVGRDKLQIHLAPSKINANNRSGAFAWWVSGENQKARLPKPYEPSDDTPGRWAISQKSHVTVDPKPFGMENLLADPKPAQLAITLKQSDLIVPKETKKPSKEFYHDLSTTSTGLLTNTATGGWRKDLSLLTENWDLLPTSGLPFFRVKPGKDILYERATNSNPTPGRGMLYPWSSYRNVTTMALDRQGAASSWQHLQQHMTAYKRIDNTSASGTGSIDSYSVRNDGTSATEVYNFINKNRIMPVVARIQWIFSHWAGNPTPVAGQPAPPPGSLEPRLLLSPVVTIWNPYNVRLTSAPLNFQIPRSIPTNLRYSVRTNGTSKNFKSRPLFGTAAGGLVPGGNSPMAAVPTFVYDIKAPITLEPGECRVFSPAEGTVPVTANLPLTLEPGFHLASGHYIPVPGNDGKPMAIPPTSQIKAIAGFDTEFFEWGNSGHKGVGIYLDVNVAGRPRLAYRMEYRKTAAQNIWKPLNDLAESDSLTSLMTNPSPFMFNLFGARMASKTQIPAKGFVQSSPLSTFTSMGERNDGSSYMADYLGSDHPVNSPFDYSFESLTPFDSLLPNASDKTNRGYIITGFNKDTGLSRCVVAEIPTRPLQSLAELTHWDSRYENAIPPFAYNITANSDATPLLPANAVVNSNVSSLPANLQHDDSYCMNHVLFDDWFVSSLAPDPTDFGDNGKDLKTVCSEFVQGTSPLGNRAYHPIVEDVASSASNSDSYFNKQVNNAESWKTIASRLEVEGMFNVNSTSVTAWRALLGHARNQLVPYQSQSGATVNVSLSSKSDHAVSRFSVAGAPEATAPADGGAFSEANEFAGYRLLDDDTIDALAAEIVSQIRARGPFLSLAEFVNRQLSSGDPALAGTLQAALNQLAKSGPDNPFAVVSSPDFTKPSGVDLAYIDLEYQYPDAAVGNSAYGLPGWIRQADILRPIAPILSARDDTFTIRAYGDSRDKAGTVKARAVCEATVTRDREFVDPTDSADTGTLPTSAANQRFGRRFKIISFRWLSPAEI